MAKLNPRMIPKTQADVDKATALGESRGCELALNVILFLLMNDFNFSHEDMSRINKRTMFYMRQISSGRLKYPELRRALREEYDLEVKLT